MLTLCVSFVVALLDQLTKVVVLKSFVLGERREVIQGLFDLRYVQNTGAAWGMLQGLSHWLVALSILMLVVIVVFRRHFIKSNVWYRLAMGLMIGGIWGNLIDRVRLGYVVDFLDFFWKLHHFPAFNLADSAICTGVGLYVLLQLIEKPVRSDDAGGKGAH